MPRQCGLIQGTVRIVTLRRLAFAALLPLSACINSSPMQLYPLKGPIAVSDPTLVIEAKANNTNGTSGALSLRLPGQVEGRVKCEGTWTSVAPKVVSRTRGLSLTLKDTGGKVENGTSTVGGVNTGEIYAVCTDGTRVQGSFLIGSGTTSGTGSATDTNGNVYKLLF